jgi:acetolactate synthase-1/2/3 large subunit
MNNSELIVHMLQQAGVRWVFGIPSGPVLPLIEALGKSNVDFVLTANETSAGFMASTVGYLTGVPGVCISTLGPGATNLSTGVGSAWLDCVPLLAITCNVATPWMERRVQMRIDHHALFKPLTKATISLRDGQVGEKLNAAWALAVQEPPGPVHIDLPEDTAKARGEECMWCPPVAFKAPNLSDELAEIVASALRVASRPLVITGMTFTRSKVAQKLRYFLERQKIPFVTTLHAKGFLPESLPNFAGVIGRARRTDVRALTDRADLIIAVGFDPIEINYEEWVKSETPIIHVSSERAETGKDLRFLWNKACDFDDAIESLSRLVPNDYRWTTQELVEHRKVFESALRPTAANLAPHQVLDILRGTLPPDGILAYDVGAHTHQIASQWRTDLPKTLLATNGWSSMGYGMPAAFAAKLVHPERAVVCVVGDGGFQMTAGELSVARRLNLVVPTIVLNDGWLGLMKVKQERRKYRQSGVHLGTPPDSPPHYFGVPCCLAKTTEEFRRALSWAFSQSGPSVIEAFVEAASYSYTVFD